MKRLLKTTALLICLFVSIHSKLHAQTYVTIPDANFVTWLQTYYPTCMSGNQMDITCSGIVNATSVNVSYKSIANLSGIEYFTNLEYLFCQSNNIFFMPYGFPPSIKWLDCSDNPLGFLTSLPSQLEYLDCSLTNITYLPNLANSLLELRCNNNQLISLPATLPSSLLILECSVNQLTSLPTLPASLQKLGCYSNQLTSLPILPTTLTSLTCNSNQLSSLSDLPNSLTELYCNGNRLTSLPTLPDALTNLNCSFNQLTSLPNIPTSLLVLHCEHNALIGLPPLQASLTTIYCNTNQLTSLPALPASLIKLYCNDNQLTSLPSLPTSLILLDCYQNLLTSLPELPASLPNLDCYNNQLTSLPALPASLTSINCSNNQLTSLPNLPASLTSLKCWNNQLNNLPLLTSSITVIHCYDNQLTSLPVLPASLTYLECGKNQLTSLPTLPDALSSLRCTDNQLTSLPTLPSSLSTLYCQNNNISCFPIFPNTINSITLFSNPFSCLPNYIPAMYSTQLSYPLCSENDPINNPSGCDGAIGIVGSTMVDVMTDCSLNSSDIALQNISIQLYDQNDSLIRRTFSAINGIYQFPEISGTYTAKIDTTNMPFALLCSTNSQDTTVILTDQVPLVDSIDFLVSCNPGFALGTRSVMTNGWVFPGQNHELKIITGDLSQFYNLNCASGISGQVQFSVSGPVNYQANIPGTLIPTVTGNTYTYDIADFGTTDIFRSFGIVFQINSTAETNDQICVSVNVTSEAGDYNLENNSYEYCYPVVNSYDPNTKEVYPMNVNPGYEDYFTYTIHFQNTGNAPAFNIRLLDTLDSNLDLETFQITNYSHYQTADIKGNKLTFHFPNIMLPDSTSNPEGSKGYVQYRIKPKIGLAPCTQVKNTAYIYFDFNAPVVTNTTINEFIQNTVNLGTFANPSVCAASDGSVQINGTGNGTLSWTGVVAGSIANFDLGNTVTNLGAGTYELIFNSSCSSDTIQVTLTNPLLSAPSITANDPTTFCEGESITLTSSSATGNTWSNGETSQSITVNTAGTYSVSINDGNCSSQNSDEVITIVNPQPPTPSITTNGATTFCEGESITLTSSSATGNTWSTGETSQSIVVNTADTYTVSINDGNCSSANSNEVITIVNPLPSTPTITASGATTFCEGENITLTSSSATGNTWSTGETSQYIVVNTAGTYSVSINDGNCSSPNSDEVITLVNPLPSTPSITANGATTFCEGESITLTSSSASGNTWSTGETSQSIVVNTADTYTVSINDGNCSSPNSDEVITLVNPLPSTPTITASGATTFCEGENITLTSSSATGNTWSTGETSQSIVVNTADTYSVLVNDGNCSSQNSNEIITIVNPLPPLPIIATGGPLSFCEGENVVLTSDITSGIQWSNGSTNASITVSSAGTFTVTNTVNGCSSLSDEIVTTVNPLPDVSIASIADVCDTADVITLNQGSPIGGTYIINGLSVTTFTPSEGNIGQQTVIYYFTQNGCTNAASTILTVIDCSNNIGLLENKLEMLLFPNPTSGVIYLKGDYLAVNIEVYDQLGREVHQCSDCKNLLDLSAFADGIYTLKIKGENGSQMHKIQLLK